MELSLNGFENLSELEMIEVDGGIKWNDVGLAVSAFAGGCIGAQIGTAVTGGNPVGTVVGGIAGTATAIVIYTAFEK